MLLVLHLVLWFLLPVAAACCGSHLTCCYPPVPCLSVCLSICLSVCLCHVSVVVRLIAPRGCAGVVCWSTPPTWRSWPTTAGDDRGGSYTGRLGEYGCGQVKGKARGVCEGGGAGENAREQDCLSTCAVMPPFPFNTSVTSPVMSCHAHTHRYSGQHVSTSLTLSATGRPGVMLMTKVGVCAVCMWSLGGKGRTISRSAAVAWMAVCHQLVVACIPLHSSAFIPRSTYTHTHSRTLTPLHTTHITGVELHAAQDACCAAGRHHQQRTHTAT